MNRNDGKKRKKNEPKSRKEMGEKSVHVGKWREKVSSKTQKEILTESGGSSGVGSEVKKKTSR